MALLFADGFDHYAVGDVGKKWTYVNSFTMNASGGRRGGGAIIPNTIVATVLPTGVTTLIVGVAFKNINNPNMMMFNGLTSGQIIVGVTSSGEIIVYRVNYAGNWPLQTYTAVELGRTAALTVTAKWYYLEVKVVLHISAGSVTVRLDTATVLTLSGIRTLYTESVIQAVGLNNVSQGTYFDDFYVCDTTGSSNNDFLGDTKVCVAAVTGNGAVSDGVASAGSNYQCVDETTPSSTDYVTFDATNEIDTYTVGSLSSIEDLKGVYVRLCAAKSDTQEATITDVIRSGGTNRVSATPLTLYSDHVYRSFLHEVDPATSAKWTPTGFNASEFGIKKTA